MDSLTRRILAHSTGEIVPEPPDGPPDEPPTPDDVGPCPFCGGIGILDGAVGEIVRCGGDCGGELVGGTWSRLARAAALLEACEQLGQDVQNVYCLRASEKHYWSVGIRGADILLVIDPSLADALIALAREVRHAG